MAITIEKNVSLRGARAVRPGLNTFPGKEHYWTQKPSKKDEFAAVAVI